MIKLETVEESTPVGTSVVVVLDTGAAYLTKTRSRPWELGRHLVVLVEGIAGGYIADRCHILLSAPES